MQGNTRVKYVPSVHYTKNYYSPAVGKQLQNDINETIEELENSGKEILGVFTIPCRSCSYAFVSYKE